MDRDTLDFVLVGSIGVALVLCLAAAILNDLGLISFYLNAPKSNSAAQYMLALACCLLLFLPFGLFLEKQMIRHHPAKRNWHTMHIPSQNRSVRVGIWQIDHDEEKRARS